MIRWLRAAWAYVTACLFDHDVYGYDCKSCGLPVVRRPDVLCGVCRYDRVMAGEEMSKEKQIEIDHIILVCTGCKGERRFELVPHLIGAEALIKWMKSKPKQCKCGAPTCDVRAHLVGTPEEIDGLTESLKPR